MSEITLDDLMNAVNILKAQQQADAVVIQCLVCSFMAGTPLHEMWAHGVSHSVVGEQLYAQANALAAATLGDFKDRLSFWDGIIKSLADDHAA